MAEKSCESKRLMEYLENGEFEVRFSWINKNTYGLVDPLKEVILISLSLHLVESYVHEYLHIQHPELEEEAICEKTRKLIFRLKKKDIVKLGEKLIDLLMTEKETSSKKSGKKNHDKKKENQ